MLVDQPLVLLEWGRRTVVDQPPVLLEWGRCVDLPVDQPLVLLEWGRRESRRKDEFGVISSRIVVLA
jgi:hypothetical protein